MLFIQTSKVFKKKNIKVKEFSGGKPESFNGAVVFKALFSSKSELKQLNHFN